MITDKDFKILLSLVRKQSEEIKELKELVKGNPKLTEPEKFLTRRQAEEFLQVSERQLTYMLAKDRLPFATKVGGQWRFPKSELERYMARI